MHSQRDNYNPNPNNENLGRYYNAQFLIVNGKKFPMTKVDTGKQITATTVSEARNSLGVFIGQKVGRDKTKVEYVAPVLTSEEWSSILKVFKANFVNNVTYFDMVENTKVTRKMYVNDRSATPLSIDDNGNVLAWKDCSLNLIDIGE